jgi:hypothetical protein
MRREKREIERKGDEGERREMRRERTRENERVREREMRVRRKGAH